MLQNHLMKIASLVFIIMFLLEFSVSDQSCTPERFYCGHQVPHAPQAQRAQNTTLWQCDTDGISLMFSYSCNFGCNAVNGGDSYCFCLQNKHYCGHELNDIGWKADANSIYHCIDNGLNASLIEKCSKECKAASHSHCSSKCKDGENYCGYMLKELGWDGYENDALYQCHGGNETRFLTKCSPGMCHSSYCKCNPGHYYCGHELFEHLRWTNFKSRQRELLKCTENGSHAYDYNKYSCQECISGDHPPHCECKIGNTYCGTSLHILGWDGYENDTLYLCERGHNGSRLTELMKCGDGKCSHYSCACTRGRLYCGHELYQLGMIWNSTEAQYLYHCTYGTYYAEWIASCSACHNDGVVSRCKCTFGDQYCGHELHKIGWEGYENKSLYNCANNGLNASLTETCSVQCKAATNRNSFCFRQCQDSENYCGYRLKEIGWDGSENDTLYQCQFGNEMRVLSNCSPGMCHSDSCKCNPSRYYCGHELYDHLGWKKFESRRTELLKCAPNRTYLFDFNRYNCQDCISGDHPSHCECKIGNTYCGSNLHISGFDGYENDTLYLCEQGHNGSRLTELMPCGDGKCKDDGCDCIHDKLYCGHELLKLGWHGHEDHSLYKCADNRRNASLVETCSIRCKASKRQSFCFRQCQHGENYCGKRLNELGWEGYENDTLYQCRGGNETSVWSTCSPGMCHSDSCKCNPGRYYCGFELYENLGWSKSKSRRTELFMCFPNGTDVFVFNEYTCQDCINGDRPPHCECKIGKTYCGSFLHERGWDGYEKDTLYLCKRGHNGSRLSKLMPCGEGKCNNNACDCTRDKLYCGHELYLMGFRNLSSAEHQWLFLCTRIDGTNTIGIGSCSVCHNTGGVSRCDCTLGNRYCGHELLRLGWKGYENRFLYNCTDNGLSASLIEICSELCKANAKPNRQSFCFRQCQPGQNYCGYVLKEIGWAGHNNDTLYQCRGGNETSVRLNCLPGGCHADQCICNPHSYYCGRELYEQLGLTNYESRQTELFKCAPYGGSIFDYDRYTCEECISGDHPPHCECKIGETYCGSNLHERGWYGYENDTLYLCEPGHNGSRLTEQLPCGDGKCSNYSCNCIHDKLYCGHELDQMGWSGFTSKVQHNVIWQCFDRKNVKSIASCSICHNTGIVPWCDCTPGDRYCGHELLQQGWEGYENNNLYNCLDNGQNASLIETCSILCKAILNQDSFCFRQCQDGQNYCGYRLREIGWERYEKDTLYQCLGKKETRFLWKCPPGMCYSDNCKCNPNQYYCGHEFIEQLGWTNYKSRQLELFKCAPNGTVSWIANCNQCNNTATELTVSGDQHLKTCKCRTGDTYCGYTLQEMGWGGYETDTLYLCEEGRNGSFISKLMACGDGKCRYNGACECARDKLYCGHQLYKMGWRQLTSVNDQARLGRCTNGSNVAWIASCDYCYNSGSGSKCDCTSGINYCGSKINQMGYQSYNNDSIYFCKDTNSPLADTGETNILCSQDCIPGRSYCGYEIQYVRNVAKDDLQTRYICNNDKTFKPTILCGRCIKNDVTGAYCHCVPGWRHCASVLYTTGWKGFSESLVTAYLPKNFTNDTIFQCKDEENVEYIESCGMDECKYKAIGGAYCVCSPNRTYCGHELYEYYNSMETKLDPNYIYRCSETMSTVSEQERCRKCLRLYGKPYCRHEFSIPWFVGGIAALVFVSFLFVLIRTLLQHQRLRKLMERKRIDVAQLTVSKRLGQGEFGEVWKGTYTNSEGNSRDVALKLAKGRIDAANCFLQEVMTLDIVNHENIIKVFGVCLNFIDEGGNTVPALVLELMNGGSSISYMRSERNRLNGRDLLRIFQDICKAGDHLCKLGFVHRDIAARNVLVQNNPQTGHVTVAKLTDFGLAKDIGKLDSMFKDTNHDQTRLPFRYLAPEGFERCFCFKSDVWSFGVFMWELYTVMEEEDVLAELRLEQGRSGPLPYSELNNVADVLAEAYSDRKLKQPKKAPEKMYKIMRQCWAVKSETRPTFEELISSFNMYGTGNIIEPPVTFLSIISSENNNGARKDKENIQKEKDNHHDQDMYVMP